MRSPLSRVIPAILLCSFVTARAATAMDATVPSIPYPDVQTAVAALALSPDVDNHIFITQPAIFTSSSIVIGPAFSAARTLTIRPATTVSRAQILSNDVSGQPIFSLNTCGSVHMADLDVVRDITNNGNLVETSNTTFITFERCRIGSDSSPNAAGLSFMLILYPGDGGVMIRNCIFFSKYKNAFDYAIQCITGDSSNELFLYNDCIADYNRVGLTVSDGNIGSLILARNDVFVNNTISVPEPTAVSSSIVPGVVVVTSDNLAFASPANVQTGFPPNQDLFGTAASQAPVDLPATALEETNAFTTMTWNPTPGDLNPDFYRPTVAGDLHTPGAYGIIVGLKSPDAHDQAVVDDINRNIRPGGSPLHVDRGPYQLDPSTSGVGDPGGLAVQLRVAPVDDPARSFQLAYACGVAGELSVEVFDVSGRRVGALRREVSRGGSGVLVLGGARASGLYLYRARMRTAAGEIVSSVGRLSLMR